MLGFYDWCRCVPWCRGEAKVFGYISRERRRERINEYRQIHKVLKQYRLLRASLTDLQKQILSEYLI